MRWPAIGALGIRTKLVILVAALLGVISGVLFAYLPAQAWAAKLRALATETDAIARMTGYSMAPALLFEDHRSADEVLEGAAKSGRAAYVVVVDEAGEVFAARALGVAREAEFAARDASSPAAESYYRTAFPVERDGVRLGVVYVGASLAPLRVENDAVLRATAALQAAVLLVGLAAAWAIGSLVTRPLRQMVRVAREIGAGSLELRVPEASGGEAGELATSFNEMLDRLEAARAQLESLNHDLESRVEERTHELASEVREHRLSADALRRANDRFLLAAAAVDGAIYDYDVPSGRIEWTDGIRRVFAYPADEVEAGHGWREERIHPEDREETLGKMASAILSGSDFVAEYRFRSGSGDYLHVFDRGRVVTDDGGRTLRIVGVMEDVSTLRRLEEQYQHAQRMEAVGRLAGGVAHDFNNLLTAILGYADITLSALADAAPEREYVVEIRKAGERAAALTQQLLTFSRKQVVRPSVLDVNELLADLRPMIERLIGASIRLESDLAPDVLCVKADRGQLEQVILNVVVNARDAMPAGGTLRLSSRSVYVDRLGAWGETGAKPGRHVALEIRDTGCGMDEETLARVFEPFFTTKAAGAGTGLGMATTYAIVSQNQGRIRLESTPDEGTDVTLLFPQAEGAVPQALPAPDERPVEGGSETVLVVEDEEGLRKLVARTLSSEGYRVVLAADGLEAVELAAGELERIDLVITDVVMPRMGGREAVEELRRRRPGLPALFVSGYTDDTVLHHGVSADQAPFLGKPFTRAELLGKVRELLNGGAPAAPRAGVATGGGGREENRASSLAT